MIREINASTIIACLAIKSNEPKVQYKTSCRNWM